MVKKNKKQKTEDTEIIEVVETPTENENVENENDNVEFINFLNEFQGSEYKIDVRKLSKDGSIWERVKTIPLDQFSPDLIAETYGGGKYRFRVLNESGKFVKQFTCVYAEPIKKEPENKIDKSDLTLQILLNQINSTNQMMIEMIRNYRPPEIKEQFKISDLLNLITSIKQLYPSQDVSQILEFLKTGIELGQNASGETSTFDKVLDLFTKLYGARLGNINYRSLNGYQTKPLTNPQINSQNNSQNNIQMNNQQNLQSNKTELQNNTEVIIPKNDLENKIFLVFTPYKQLFLQSYKSNLPTTMVSLYVFNLCDDEILNMIYEYFNDEENYERFSKFTGVSVEYIKLIVNELRQYGNNISEK